MSLSRDDVPEWAEETIECFNRAWELAVSTSSPPPNIKAFLQGLPDEARKQFATARAMDRSRLLVELIKVDMDRSWASDKPHLVKSYLRDFPELEQDRDALLKLIGHESKLRRDQGEHPFVEEYVTRFPQIPAGIIMAALDPEGTRRHWRAGERVGKGDRFKLHKNLGEGSFGEVWLAWDSEYERHVALKLRRASGRLSVEDIEQFKVEAKTVASLNHRGIPQLFEWDFSEREVFLIYEYVEGETLDHIKKGLTIAAAADVVCRVAEIVHAAHSAKEKAVIHRDLKPSNILIDKDGAPHVIDFGLALPKRRADNNATVLFGLGGTPRYMPPEQFESVSDLDVRADVYSLGVVLYDLLCGRCPFDEGDYSAIKQAVRTADPPRPRELNLGIPRDLEAVCLKAMAKDRDRRYCDMREFAEDLQHWLRKEPVQARRIGAIGRLARWCRRRPAVATLLLVVAVSLLGGTLVSSWGWRAAEKARRGEQDQRKIAERKTREAEAAETDAKIKADAAIKAQIAEEAAKRRAEEKAAEAARNRDQFATLLAKAYVARGVSLVDRGLRNSGLLWLGRALETTPVQDTAFRRSVTMLIASVAQFPDGQPTPFRQVYYPPNQLPPTSTSTSIEPSAFAASLDGRWALVTAPSGGVQLRDQTSGTATVLPIDTSRVVVGSFSADGKILVTAHADNVVRAWQVPGFTPIGREVRCETAVADVAHFREDARSNGIVAIATHDTAIHFWDLETGVAVGGQLTDDYWFLAGTTVKWCYYGPTTTIGPGKEAPPSTCVTETPLPRRIAVSSDGKFVATARSDRTVRIWDWEAGAPIATTTLADGVSIHSVHFSDDKERPELRISATDAEGKSTILAWSFPKPVPDKPKPLMAWLECVTNAHFDSREQVRPIADKDEWLSRLQLASRGLGPEVLKLPVPTPLNFGVAQTDNAAGSRVPEPTPMNPPPVKIKDPKQPVNVFELQGEQIWLAAPFDDQAMAQLTGRRYISVLDLRDWVPVGPGQDLRRLGERNGIHVSSPQDVVRYRVVLLELADPVRRPLLIIDDSSRNHVTALWYLHERQKGASEAEARAAVAPFEAKDSRWMDAAEKAFRGSTGR